MKDRLSKLFDTKIKRVYRIIELLLLAASLIFFIYEKKTPDPLHFEEDDFISESINNQPTFTLHDIALKRGVYNFSLTALSSEEGSTIMVDSPSLRGVRFRSGQAELPTTSLSSYVTADLRGSCEDLSVYITPSEESLFEIISLDVVKTTNMSKRSIILSLFVIIVLELILWLSQKDTQARKTAFLLTAISLACSYPLFSDFLLESHDVLFHLARIEGLAEGLKSGLFPVKVQPFWGNDYGYAVGVFYGDILLYFPALLRLFGFPVQTAFQIYIFFIQFATVLISYFSFNTIFKKSSTALFGTMLYAFSTYRLLNTYTRAAVGEFTAAAFLPLVLCGFFMILSDSYEKKTGKDHIKASLVTALSLTGLIGCHILSCQMIAFFILIVLIVYIKKVFVKRTFIDLLISLLMTISLNIGFLVPFIDFYFQPLNIRSESWGGTSSNGIQEYGISPLQLFSVFGKTFGGNVSTSNNINVEPTFTCGIVLILLLVAFAGLVFIKKETICNRKFYKLALLMAVLGALSLYMATEYFPWNAIASANKGFGKFLSNIQFPWRFLSFATVFLVFVACFLFEAFKDILSKEIFTAIVSLAIGLTFITSSWYLSHISLNDDVFRVYDTYEVCNYAFYTCEYLYEGTDYKAMIPNQVSAKNVEVADFTKKGTTILVNITSVGGGYVDFPLNYYKHYTCKSTDGQEYKLTTGQNNCIRLKVPKGYSGSIKISFTEPFYWRLAELISALTFILVCGYLCIINRKI